MPKLSERQLYCVSCRALRTIPADDLCVKIYKNPKMYDGKAPALRAQCPHCGTNLTKFVKHDAVDRLIDKYGKC